MNNMKRRRVTERDNVGSPIGAGSEITGQSSSPAEFGDFEYLAIT